MHADADIEAVANKTLEFVPHDLWTLLEILPEEVRPKSRVHLNELMEITTALHYGLALRALPLPTGPASRPCIEGAAYFPQRPCITGLALAAFRRQSTWYAMRLRASRDALQQKRASSSRD